jgi:hypothetical protein
MTTTSAFNKTRYEKGVILVSDPLPEAQDTAKC